jgi:flagella basal body P-ring formation protein FlgA
MRAPLLALLLGANAMAGPRVEIELRPEVQATRATVVLGEVAYLRSMELPLMEKLVRIPMGRAPTPGQEGTVRREDVQRWLETQAGLLPTDIAWRGAVQARIVHGGGFVSGERIAHAARDAVRAALAARGEDPSVDVVGLPRSVETGGSAVHLRPRAVDTLPLRRRQLVWVDVWSGESFLRTVPVSLEIAPATNQPSTPMQYSRSDGKAAHPQEGSPAVLRGEWADLRSAAGAVVLQSRVEVLQDGRRGESVRVRQPGATALIQARVVGRGQLEVAP